VRRLVARTLRAFTGHLRGGMEATTRGNGHDGHREARRSRAGRDHLFPDAPRAADGTGNRDREGSWRIRVRCPRAASGLWSRPSAPAQHPRAGRRSRGIGEGSPLSRGRGRASGFRADDAAVAISASEAASRAPAGWKFGNVVGTTRWIAKERVRQESARYCGVVLGKGPSSWDYEGAWTPGFAVSFELRPPADCSDLTANRCARRSPQHTRD
jgi:hypothetical protein